MQTASTARRFAEQTIITCPQTSLSCLKSLLVSHTTPALHLLSPSGLVSLVTALWPRGAADLQARRQPLGAWKSLPPPCLSALRSLEFNASWCRGLCLAYFHIGASKVAVTASAGLRCQGGEAVLRHHTRGLGGRCRWWLFCIWDSVAAHLQQLHRPSAQQLSHVWGLDGGGRAATRLHFVFPSAIPGRGWVGGKVKFLTGYMGPDSKHCF